MNVLKRIRPSRSERERLHRVTQQVIAAAESAIASRNLSATVGSKLVLLHETPGFRTTKRRSDIDIFIGFDTSTSREDLERYGLEIGKEIAVEGYIIGFAEHPYVKARCGGFAIDVVPHYRSRIRAIYSQQSIGPLFIRNS